MAKFDIPGNYDRVSTAFISDVSSRFSGPISYTPGSNELFVYSNYPEYINNNHLGDGNNPVYLAKVTADNKSKLLIYVTHHLDNLTGGPFKLAIRVYNPNEDSITFTKVHEGYNNKASSDEWNNPGLAWEDFFVNRSGSVPVAGNTSEWLVVKDITKYGTSQGYSFLDYFGEFTVTGDFVIAVYICKNINSISSNASDISWNTSQSTYSGYSNCYSLTSERVNINMADALVSYEHSFFYGISNPYQGWGSSDERITMYATDDKIPVTYNIGNYGYQYKMSFRFRNTSGKPVQIKAYLISNNVSHFAGLSSLNGCSKFLSNQSEASSNRWNFFTHNRLESGSGYVDIEFTYSHLALGSRGAILQFKAIELT